MGHLRDEHQHAQGDDLGIAKIEKHVENLATLSVEPEYPVGLTAFRGRLGPVGAECREPLLGVGDRRPFRCLTSAAPARRAPLRRDSA